MENQNVIELTEIEIVTVSGGDKFMRDLGYAIGAFFSSVAEINMETTCHFI